MNEPMNTEPNKPSATPETDGVTLKAQPGGMVFYDTVPAEFARRLERERDEANAENDRLRAAIQRAEDTEKQLLEVAQIVHENSHPQQLRARLFNLLMKHMPDGPNANMEAPPDSGTKDHE